MGAEPLLQVPELGPALGRLILPAGVPVSAPPAPAPHLTDLRLALVTGLFDRAGKARAALSTGDAATATMLLAPEGWRELWNKAASGAALLVQSRIDGALGAAAARSRFPPRRFARLTVTPTEARSIELRLTACAAPLAEPLAEVARTRGSAEWAGALVGAAQALELSWLALEGAAFEEEEAWQPEIARIARWRPARWPRWVAATLIVGAGFYIGLVLGGYLPVPAPLKGAAQFWWNRVEG